MAEPELYGSDLFGQPVAATKRGGAISERFLVPPFSILNSSDGWWQDRKRAWIGLGIKSELGRDAKTYNIGDRATWDAKTDHTTASAPAMALDGGYDTPNGTAGVSIFDPVLCELCYRWFCPPGGMVLDPFAGGSVRGVVASMTGRRYWGCDLRAEQVRANRRQAVTLGCDPVPEWVCGDSRCLLAAGPDADFIFSCPPYGDLEVYSDDPADLSNMGHAAFLSAYRDIVSASCGRLCMDRFACFVVGDFRDERGHYRNFVSHTIQAFLDAGLRYYNEGILVTPCGTLPVRIGRQFTASRKFGKQHQNVLVFVKGDGKRAAAACGEVEV